MPTITLDPTAARFDLDPDTDVWVEACVSCDSTDNHGNAYCAFCDD